LWNISKFVSLLDLGNHHLSEENAILREQMVQSNRLFQENQQLRSELARHQQSNQRNATSNAERTEIHQQSQESATWNESVPQNHTRSQENAVVHEKSPEDHQEADENAALREQVSNYRDRHAELLQNFEKLNAELKKKKIDSFEALAEQDKESMKILIELARLTQPMPMQGNNIGLFGLTSTGKSTMLNSLFGQKEAETGVGETTTEITPYQGSKYTLWDVPGRNDEVAYLNMEYIAFFKGLSRRLILIQATVKENSSMMKLLDEIGLHYAIVVNKFDSVNEEEQTTVRQQIKNEVDKVGLKGVDHVFFVSAKKPKMFSDWLEMVDYLENLPKLSD